MEKPIQSRRKELAITLLSNMKYVYEQLTAAATAVEKGSNAFYEEAFAEKRTELDSVMESYRKNVERIREINKEITTSVNSWYDFAKSEEEMGKLFFPLVFRMRKNDLYKKIKVLNGEISSITINNRFLREQLTVLEHQLEIKAVSLARAGGNFQEYEKLLLQQKKIMDELKYLLPTIPGICPADISPEGVDRLIGELG